MNKVINCKVIYLFGLYNFDIKFAFHTILLCCMLVFKLNRDLKVSANIHSLTTQNCTFCWSNIKK